MNNKNKKTKKSKLPLILTVVGLLLVVGATAGFIFQDKIKTVANDVKVSIENQGKPKFTFDTAKFPDWATAGNVYTNSGDITDDFIGNKDDLPISGINVSQCENGSNCNKLVKKCEPWSDDKADCKALAKSTTNTHCFVMAFYNERKIDPEEEVTKYIDHNKSFGSMIIQEAGIKTLTMDTPEGEKEYKLHYYDYQNKGSDTIKRGNAIGYISLTDGHIDVRSVCSETNQLDETLPVLSAIRLEV